MLSGKGKLQHRMHDAICIKHTKKWKYTFVKGEKILEGHKVVNCGLE